MANMVPWAAPARSVLPAWSSRQSRSTLAGSRARDGLRCGVLPQPRTWSLCLPSEATSAGGRMTQTLKYRINLKRIQSPKPVFPCAGVLG